MNIKKSIADNLENVGIVIVEMYAPPVLDDIVEHVLQDTKKIFIKDFNNKNSIEEDLKEFSHDISIQLKSDFHLIKSISSSHFSHGHTLQKFLENSLLNNGFESLTTAGAIAAFGVESIPIVVASVIAEQIIERNIEPTIKSTIFSIRNSFHSSEKTNTIKPQ